MTLDIKALKQELKNKTDKDPDKYYATSVLKKEGYARKKCRQCERYFWSMTEEQLCGEPDCIGGYQFIGSPPTKKKIGLVESWHSFEKFFEKRDYKSIKRYPTVARWRDDADFVQASIYDFQPYVVSGEIEPPANPLVVPQYCVRFNSIESVGLTGRHNTGFIMTGQHAFDQPNKFPQEKYFRDLYEWFVQEMGVPKQEMKFHESQWGGGGNLGVCMEVFSRGLELANQVYMLYEITEDGYKDMRIKVLDMGMGQDRPAWLTQGTNTIYEVDYPEICKKLYNLTGVKPTELYHKFISYGSILDVDSNVRLFQGWRKVSNSLKMDEKELKKEILPLAALYSIADHTQALLFTIADGMLPSNVGGGYNLRIIARRALGFIDEYGWKVSLPEICEWHADSLKEMYPELTDSVEEVKEILEFEISKYKKTLDRARKKVSTLIDQSQKFEFSNLVTLYESDGITPELIKEIAKKTNKEIELPENFYSKLAETREKIKKEKKEQLVSFDLKGLEPTEKLFYQDIYEFNAIITAIKDNYVVLDRTAFYATSGGQESDIGYIGNQNMDGAIKVGDIILHRVQDSSKFKKGEQVHCKLDRERRKQLSQHHTAVHIINGSARKLLGNHIWQAGAEKTAEKARLDITHYDLLSDKQLKEIEKLANKVVGERRKVIVTVLPRQQAEAKYGFRLYQGGAIPSKTLRVIEIQDWDIEACGGTHVSNTLEVGPIKIIRSKKIQDGIIRLEFVAGEKLAKKAQQDLKLKESTELKAWKDKIVNLVNEGKRYSDDFHLRKDLDNLNPEQLFKEWKYLSKKLLKLKQKKAGEMKETEPVQYMEQPDMKLMQEIGRNAVKQDSKAFVIIIAPGSIYAIKGMECKKDLSSILTKVAQKMKGSIGEKKEKQWIEYKGGGSLKDNSKQIFEQLKKELQ